MHVHLEENGVTRSDCCVQALSWMGKVPETTPDEAGWRLNKLHYYQEGWLAGGNARGIVGVTFTTCHCKKNYEPPARSNFNLRGHRNEVMLVKWNEPYQKLATCDVTGVIFVWIKHEGRWSIELINDRNSQVKDFAWSHDGRMALICYIDGFVLVGSVAGQRYWSSMLNLGSCLITCGVWSPDDQKVLFGTSDGQVVVMSATGAMLAQVTLSGGAGHDIASMAWSCQRFFLEDQEQLNNRDNCDSDSNSNNGASKTHVLAVCFKSGDIDLMTNYDDICPRHIHTGFTGVKMEWCNDGEILAVGGFVRQPNLDCNNQLRFYTRDGSLRYSLDIPQQPKPLTALTWGHNNRRLFVAAGCHIYTLWVTKIVAPLQYLCRRTIQQTLREETAVQKLPLPSKLKHTVTALFSNTVKGYIPDALKLREFVCVPPPTQERLHCTMIRHGEETSGGHYTLYLEYLGGLIPLLKGKRASKIRPEFVVYDPKIKTNCKTESLSFERNDPFLSSDSCASSSSCEDDAVVEGCGSPRVQRRKKRKKRAPRIERRDSTASNRPLDDLLYDDNLPETAKLVEVTSNIWGTKFKLHGMASFLPEDVGHVLYKTSLLHLQPRQMTVSIAELTNDLRPLERDPSYNPNVFSESDDEAPVQNGVQEHCQASPSVLAQEVPISPDLHLPPPPRLTDGQATYPSFPYQGTSTLDPGPPLEVPVIIESRLPVFQAKGEKSTCSPFEIRSLDGSPPQRRSPSVKSSSLTPADQIPYTGSTLVETNLVDGDINLGFSKDIFIEKGAIPKVKSNSTQLNQVYATNGFSNNSGGGTQLDTCDSDTDLLGVSGSQNHLVQLAAKKLEDVIQLHQCRQDGSLIIENNGNSPQNCEKRDTSQVVDGSGEVPNKACKSTEIKYIDDEVEVDSCSEPGDAVYDSSDSISARDLMKSTQMLSDLDAPSGQLSAGSSVVLSTPTHVARDINAQNRRIILANHSPLKHSKPRRFRSLNCRSTSESIDSLQDILDQSYYISTKQDNCSQNSRCNSPRTTYSNPNSPILGDRRILGLRRGSLELKRFTSKQDCSVTGSTSLPTSPVRKIVKQETKKAHSKQDISMTKHKAQSPLMKRKSRHHKHLDSSDEEIIISGDNILTGENYKNLETFQKAQLSKKLRKVRTKSLGDGEVFRNNCSPSLHRRRHFVMHNKAPLWNENSQVYQLDFGGRVTQESAKNFQIEFRGKQVMQFGRIDGNAYTLDFQYPFSAIQAFAVALANVTQRLK